MTRVRQMTAEDDSVVSRIVSAGYQFIAQPDGLTPEELARALDERCRPEYIRETRRRCDCAVAETSGQAVGYVAVGADEIQGLWVHPAHHRQGVGTALFQYAEDVLRKTNRTRMRVTTTGHGKPFYEAMGMRVAGTEPVTFGPLEGRDLVLLEKELARPLGVAHSPRCEAQAPTKTALQQLISQKAAVVFDLFHTLTAIESSSAAELPGTSEMLGVERKAWNDQLLLHSRARLAGEQRDPFQIIADMARAIDPTISDEVIEAAAQNRVKRFKTALLDIPEESIAVLRRLKAAGKRLGLVSNADCMEAAAWDGSPIADLFDMVVFSCEVGAVKPEREIYDICLKRLDVVPKETVFVGDGGSSELEGAKAVGMTTVMMAGVIRKLWPEEIDRRKPHADFVIERLTEL